MVLTFVGWSLYGQWRRFRGEPLVVHPRWGWVLCSGGIVLATYALLIQTWRTMLATWGSRIGFWDATRVWCVSNLGKYVPGKVLQIGVMGVMAQRLGVSPLAATGSAIISTVVNIAVGTAVAMLAGWSSLEVVSQGHAAAGFVLVGIVGVTLLALPIGLPWLVRAAERVLRRQLDIGALPARAVGYAVVGNLLAWVLYGVAFRALVHGLLGVTPGTTAAYIAVYASSYVMGYLMIFLPGGIGVRDLALASALPALGLATPQEGLLIAIASRLWLTVLEIVPGVFFLAHQPSRVRP